MKLNFSFSILCCLMAGILCAQSNIQQPTSINSDGAAAAASAMLDVQATDKGMLVPRMTTAQRTAIALPATGLLVFDTTTGGFWFYNGTAWQNLSTQKVLADADGDTKIQVEESPDEDIIRFDLGGTEKMVLRKNANGVAQLELPSQEHNTVVGQNAGSSLSPQAPPLTTGWDNSFFGHSAGNATTTGSGNTATGYNSLFSNTNGTFNTALGIRALQSSVSGNDNTAVGSYALFSNFSGGYNVAVGGNALLNNSTGDYNVALGSNALRSNVDGRNNVAIGKGALDHAVSDNGAVAIGDSALFNLNYPFQGRSGNVAIGSNALFSTNGADAVNNTAVGDESMRTNISGRANTAIGNHSLYSNTSGDYNTSLGEALSLNLTGNFNTSAGYASMSFNMSGDYNTAQGHGALYFNQTGDNNTAMGYRSLFTNQSGSWNTALGEYTDVSAADAAARTMLGTRAYSECDNCVVIGSVNGKNGAGVTAKIGIGTSNPTHTLEVGVDDAYKPGTSTWGVSSDLRLKDNIQPYADGLASVLGIQPVTFHYIENSGFDTEPEYVGIVAQELQQIAPYMVSENERKLKDGTSGSFLTVNNGAMTYMLINAVKELAAENTALKSQIETQAIQLANITTALQTMGISVVR